MQGIATIDRQRGSETMVVWVTKRTSPSLADHTNAVTIDMATDEQAMDKFRSLTFGCAVLLTGGSDLDGISVKGEPLTLADIDALAAATEVHQQSIREAVTAYKQHTRSAALKTPTFPPIPKAADFRASDGSPNQRTLSAANYARKAWSAWLQTEEERRRRSPGPQSGGQGGMPEGLDSPKVAAIPAELASRFHEQGEV